MLVPEKMANWILSETEKVTDLKLRTWIFEIIFERWNMAWNSYCTLKDASWIIEMLWLKIYGILKIPEILRRKACMDY